jgi:hypothetical protein
MGVGVLHPLGSRRIALSCRHHARGCRTGSSTDVFLPRAVLFRISHCFRARGHLLLPVVVARKSFDLEMVGLHRHTHTIKRVLGGSLAALLIAMVCSVRAHVGPKAHACQRAKVATARVETWNVGKTTRLCTILKFAVALGCPSGQCVVQHHSAQALHKLRA